MAGKVYTRQSGAGDWGFVGWWGDLINHRLRQRGISGA